MSKCKHEKTIFGAFKYGPQVGMSVNVDFELCTSCLQSKPDEGVGGWIDNPHAVKAYTKQLQSDLATASAALEKAYGMISVEKGYCPQCGDGSGGYYDNHGEACQCQWCYEANLIKEVIAALEDKPECKTCGGKGQIQVQVQVYDADEDDYDIDIDIIPCPGCTDKPEKLCEINNWPEPCFELCGNMCNWWNTDKCLRKKGKN